MRLEARERSLHAARARRLRDRGVVERYAGAGLERRAEVGDLATSRRRLAVQRSDRGLQDVRAAAVEGDRAVDQPAAVSELIVVPQRAVLILEQDELAVDEPGVAARVVDDHQREQAMDLGLVGHQLAEQPAEADRFGCEVDPARVPLVEDQVDDSQHRGQPVGEEMVGGTRIGIPEALIFALARVRRRFIVSGEVRNARAISSVLQTPDRAQRERDLRLGRQGRVSAAEDQLQPLVLDHEVLKLVHVILNRFWDLTGGGSSGPACAPVGSGRCAVARGDGQPRSGVGRRPRARPALSGDRERFLAGVLGELKVAEDADQVSEHRAPLIAKDLLDQRDRSTIGRTSTDPPSRADGIRAANANAASRSATSIR